jgi:peptide/nickel transport system substrate-binding protein
MVSRRAVILNIVTLALGLAACSPSAPQPQQSAPKPPAAPTAPPAKTITRDIVIGSLAEPGGLSPLAALPHHFPEHVPQTLLFDSLVEVLPDGSIGPRLATAWDTSSNLLVYTFTLTDKATWWDGRPVTASDVKFTFERMLHKDTLSSTEGVDAVDGVETVNDRTVRILLKRPTPTFLAQGGSRGIIPRHVAEGQDLVRGEFNQKPVGSGPFKLVSWARGQSIRVEANQAYFRGAPRPARVVIKVLPEHNVVLTQLRTGEINHALLTPRDLPTVQTLPGIDVREVPTLRFFDITPNYARPFFTEQKVRLALLHAIDRQAIVDKVLAGKGAVIEANTSPSSWAHHPDLRRRGYDPAAANRLLDAAGWQRGPDGTRAKGDVRLAFGVMINNYDRTLERALIAAQQTLKGVGVEMSVERLEPGTFNARRGKKEFDALARVWNPVYDPDQSGLLRAGNFYGYSNPEVDQLTTDALMAGAQSARKPLYRKLQELLYEDVTRLWLYTEHELHAVPAGTRGPIPHPINYYWNVREWDTA